MPLVIQFIMTENHRSLNEEAVVIDKFRICLVSAMIATEYRPSRKKHESENNSNGTAL